MAQEIGESRDAWGLDVWQKAEEYANSFKSDKEPFYVVYAAKQDKGQSNTFRQSFRFYRQRPPKIIGILVWYADNANGIFKLVPELSVPPDVPIDESMLSKDRRDTFQSISEVGQQMGILLA